MSPVDLDNRLEKVLEALLLASDQPLSLDQLQRLLAPDAPIGKAEIRQALERLANSYEGRAAELREVASGFRLQVRAEFSDWIHRLWQEKPPKLSRALLETLALICYRQPITRGEIEEIRGVSLSPNIVRTLMERGWIREVGVKEVPGRPALLGTTQQFLDDMNLKSLDQLPTLPEVKDLAQLEAALAKLGVTASAEVAAQAAVPEESGAAPAEPEATVH
jgi:segregation and condensation protein B